MKITLNTKKINSKGHIFGLFNINKNINKHKNSGFSLVEIMVGIMIFSIVVITGFQAIGAVGIGKIRLMNSINTDKQIYYFSEKLFEEIKKGGNIDYEEYFNRKVVGTTSTGGHYKEPSGFGNFGNTGIVGTTIYGTGFYYCRSGNGIGNKLSGSGCYNNNLNNTSLNYNNIQQRYLEYGLQFIDYNSNYDNDLGDEDIDGNIIGDDDDEYLGIGPEVFNGGENVKELYLISGDKKKRTLFRWNVELDPNAPSAATCSNIVTGTGCIGTIEYLKLEGRDWGILHDKSEYDGVIDTWVIPQDFLGLSDDIVAGSDNTDDYRVRLFPDTINVTDFKVFPYPNKDLDLSWKDNSTTINVSPYVRIQLSIKPSWKSRKRIKGDPKEINFSTTISLTDIFSK